MAGEALVKRWRHVHKVLNDFGRELVEVYLANINERGISASHELANSVSYEIHVGDRQMGVDLRLADYWKYVEYGRKAGKFPPLDSIERWIEVKGIQPMTRTQASVKRWTQHRGSIRRNDGSIPSIKSLAYLIGRKIATEGIQPRPILTTALDEVYNRFDEALNEAVTQDIKIEVDIVLEELYKLQ